MRIPLVSAGMLLAVTCFAETPASPVSKKAPVAMVGGQPIQEDELTPLIEGQMRQLRAQEYQAKRRALDELIEQKLVAAKAKDKGLSVPEFFRQEIDGKLPEPTEGELRAYYLGQKNLAGTPFEQIRNQLASNLKQQRIEIARREYIARLRQEADVSVMLQPPRLEVGFDPARTLGNPNAPVTIVEFSDFQCPYCKSASITMKAVLDKYKDNVRLAFRDFPLSSIHPQAMRAAEAGRCAADQGKFWAYHDLLFGNQGKLTNPDLSEYARSLGLDMKQFESCLLDGKFVGRVEEDVKAGMQAGVSGTPGFFINGVFVNGAQPLSAFENMIDAELASLKTQAR